MPKSDDLVRDRKVTREIHRIYWQAMRSGGVHFWISVFLFLPSFSIWNAFIPWQTASAVEAIFTRNFQAIPTFALNIALLAALQVVLHFIGTIGINRLGTIASKFIQREVFSNFLSKDYNFYTDNYIGALGAQTARLREAITDYINILLFQAPRLIVVFGSGVVIVAFHSIPLALITLLCLVVVLSFTIGTSRWRLKYRREVAEQASKLAGVIGDAITHGSTVKTFANEKFEKERLTRALVPWEKAQLKAWDTYIPANIGRNTLNALILCLLLVVTGTLYRDGQISIAIVALVQIYVIKLVEATISIGDTLKQYEQTMGAAYEPVRTMMVETTVSDPNNPVNLKRGETHEIRLTNVTFRYNDAPEDIYAVSNFNLSIKKGEKIGLVGKSGSGKTTLTRLLLRFMDVTKGSIKFDGIDARNVTQDELRSRLAYVPQEPLLFHRSIADNIAYGKPGSNERKILDAARRAHVDEFVNELPKKYQTLVGERGVKLSGGQRQRVAIARALLKDAPVLILDEATSALDSHSEVLIQKALWELMKDRTAIVVAHRLSTIQRLDRIVVMDKGKIVQIGTHTELLKDKKGIYAELWAHQSGGYIGAKSF